MVLMKDLWSQNQKTGKNNFYIQKKQKNQGGDRFWSPSCAWTGDIKQSNTPCGKSCTVCSIFLSFGVYKCGKWWYNESAKQKTNIFQGRTLYFYRGHYTHAQVRYL